MRRALGWVREVARLQRGNMGCVELSTQGPAGVVKGQATAGSAGLIEGPHGTAAGCHVAVQLELFGRVQHCTGGIEVCRYGTQQMTGGDADAAPGREAGDAEQGVGQ